MNFTIRKNSTLPTLKYDITHLVIEDESLAQRLKSGVVTFSMIDKLTGQYIIANKAGKFSVEKPVTHTVGLLNGLKYYLVYEWVKGDTKRDGNFSGEFRIDFLDEGNDTISLPDRRDSINISITGSLTSTDSSATEPVQTNVVSGSVLKQNSTLPSLKYDITPLISKDNSLIDKIKEAVATFSMQDKVSRKFAVLNKSATISVEQPDTHVVGLLNGLKYYIIYNWESEDTANAGIYTGEFRINFLSEGDDVLVIEEAVAVSILGTLTTTTYAPYRSEPKTCSTLPFDESEIGGAMVIEHTYDELKALKTNKLLKKGNYYVVTDFRSIHRLSPTGTCSNVVGAEEPLLVMATDVDKLDQNAKSLIHEEDIIHYNFDMVEPDCLTCGESRGMITFRKDTKNNLSAFYNWRVDDSVNCGIGEFDTFGEGCKNITIDSGSRFIYIGANSSDIHIGKSCSNIRLPEGSNTITIGNKVEEIDFSGFTYLPYAHRNLTIFNNGSGGQLYVDIDLFQQDIYQAGTYMIGLLPKRMMPKEYSLSVYNTSGSTDTSRISFGVDTISTDELLPETLVGDLVDAYIYNTIIAEVSEQENYVTMTIKGGDLTPPIEGGSIKINISLIKV
jgi:hypothetical protein